MLRPGKEGKENKGNERQRLDGKHIILRRVLIALFACVLVLGILSSYFPDIMLMAGRMDSEYDDLDEDAASDEADVELPDHSSSSDEQPPDDVDAADDETEVTDDVGESEETVEIADKNSKTDESEPGSGGSTGDEREEPVVNYIGEVTYDGEDYTVTVTDKSERLPADIELVVTEIEQGTEEYRIYSRQAQETVDSDSGESVGYARFFDITLLSGGREFEPESPVSVNIAFGRKMQKELTVGDEDDVRILHFNEDEKTGDIEAEIIDEQNVDVTVQRERLAETVFEAESFSVYGIVVTRIEKNVLASDGKNYKVTVTYGSESGIPDDADLSVEEILPGEGGGTGSSSAYDEYVSRTEDALGIEAGSAGYIRLFDIRIVDRNDHSKKYQPKSGTSVDVRIELADAESEELSVVHFAGGSKDANASSSRGEVVEADIDNKTVSFAADGFSVYAIVSDITVPTYENTVTSIEENVGYYLSNQSRYLTNTAYTAANPVGIGKTQLINKADLFYFERSGESNQYYVYTYTGENKDTKQYLYFEYWDSQNGHLKMSEVLPESPLTVTAYNASQGVYLISGSDTNEDGNTGTWYINQFAGTGGVRFAGWHQGTSDVGSRISITRPVDLPMDALGLDGKTYGLINFKSDISGYVMMADKFNNTRLQRKWTLIREDPLEHSGRLFIAQNADAAMWKFHAVDGVVYYLTTEIGGVTRYLNVTASGLYLTDEYNADTCNVSITTGTGSRSGKLKLAGMDGSVVRMHENAETNGYGTTTAAENDNDWLNMVVKSDLSDEDFVSYTAKKVSVSDEVNVADGRQVVVYTRVWNDTKKAYEFYAIDHDGSLIRVYENGAELDWIGTRINTLLWDFTEYRNTDGSLNYYYELQNNYSGKYLAPQIKNNTVLSDSTVGINLPGRRYGEYETSILTWDDPNYQYAGFKVQNGRLMPCPLSEAEDFYFAVMEPAREIELTRVDTVDNNDFGITMKMQDYNGTKIGQFDQTQTDVMGSTGNDKGLVRSYLDEDGYPTAVKTGTSLSELFRQTQDVNHLFLAQTYNESGYFEYNSTENFAHLVQAGDAWLDEGYSEGDFVVYDQVGTIETSNQSLKHGQFMPYNDLDGTVSGRWTNQTNETDAVLPYTDPRKDKLLYTIPYDTKKSEGEDNNANYHFGMEMTANFTQTASGLDAWGHDIIFEFAGDDDMFFYVDGVLILDLGGVHAAQTGKVNFRTGAVTTSSRGNTNLLELFKTSYKAQYGSDSGMNEWLEGFFKKDANGKLTPVFLDYSTHTMRMIYMERGAGASNLHMRFNLAAVRSGAFVLNKKLSGTDSSSNDLIEFPYQIFYRTEADGDKSDYHLLGENEEDRAGVVYKDSTSRVKYAPSFTPSGGASAYAHVFFLKAGQSAEVILPEGTVDYYVSEVGINPAVYDDVKVNGESIDGIRTANTAGDDADKVYREDYACAPASLEDRSQVDYVNHVSEGAMRTLHITKRLYDADGSSRLSDDEDDAAFTFRLYLGNENTEEGAMPLANLYTYYVLDPDGTYCRWNADDKKFVAITYKGNPVREYSVLSEYLNTLAGGKLGEIEFRTSMNGSISKIPADHTVEVRDLIVDTRYKVEEREYEIPKGYTIRLEDGYTVMTEDGELKHGTEPVSGVTVYGEDPDIEVRNQKGWGLTVRKTWTDRDFMASHDPIYFAVYVREGEGMRLLQDTVRQMTDAASGQELYYFFGNLQSGTPFSDYQVREVTVTPAAGAGEITADKNGYVKVADESGRMLAEVTAIEDDGKLVIGGVPSGGSHQDGFEYSVTYNPGEQTTQNENVRTDEVINSRPGIRLIKTDWNWNALGGAVFALKDAEGNYAAADSAYTSDPDSGLITTAYLRPGRYSLNEIYSPRGYAAMSQEMVIDIDDSGRVEISGADENEYRVEKGSDSMTATITIRDRTVSMKAVKVCAENGKPISGTVFSLYRRVLDSSGNLVKDYLPVKGYESIVTDEEGRLPGIGLDQGSGTYYLTEVRPAPGYEGLSGDIIYTVSSDGTVRLDNNGTARARLEMNTDDDTGSVSYTLIVSNGMRKSVRVSKRSEETSEPLAGAKFELYSADDLDQNNNQMKDDAKTITSGTTDESGEWYAGTFPLGEYILIETAAPAGYNVSPSPFLITVREDTVSVKRTDDEGVCKTSYIENDNEWEIEIRNSAGTELPSTGGGGTAALYIVGMLLIAASLCIRRIHKAR